MHETKSHIFILDIDQIHNPSLLESRHIPTDFAQIEMANYAINRWLCSLSTLYAIVFVILPESTTNDSNQLFLPNSNWRHSFCLLRYSVGQSNLLISSRRAIEMSWIGNAPFPLHLFHLRVPWSPSCTNSNGNGFSLIFPHKNIIHLETWRSERMNKWMSILRCMRKRNAHSHTIVYNIQTYARIQLRLGLQQLVVFPLTNSVRWKMI